MQDLLKTNKTENLGNAAADVAQFGVDIHEEEKKGSDGVKSAVVNDTAPVKHMSHFIADSA